MAFVCTDDGQHERIEIESQVFRGPQEELTPERLMATWATSAYQPGPCKECGRNPALRAAKLFKLARASVEQMTADRHRVEWDLTYLDR